MLPFALVVVLLLPTVTSAQMSPGKIALTASVPRGADVGLAYAASKQTRVNLGIGFSAAQPETGASRSEFLVHAGAWYLQPAFEGVSMFFGGGVEFLSQSGSTSKGDLGILAQAGAEYSVTRSFAIAGLVGIGYSTGDTSASGSSGSRFATSDVAIIFTWWVI
ncbi:MAG: hypothetical protein MUE68_01620 [Bacteroidetes bacterium]|nr:hypothetical protein [Bacteroidota bacterium]